MRFEIDESNIIIEAVDFGPGIEDVDLVLQEGYSTANEWIRSMGFGAGMGLSNTKRVADEFEIQSELGKGTHIKSIIYLGGRDEV
jgi:anti-sigma regulatory factor (Ser/Thr protein kinase)